MRVAIIGTGVSGNVVARLLHRDHDLHVFEAGDQVGGHARTVRVEALGGTYHVDVGFMVFNDRTYPNFLRMLGDLGVESRPSDMSFSVRCERSGWEYQGSSLDGLFAQRGNLVRPAFWGMLRDIFRFNRQSPRVLETQDSCSIGEYLAANGYGAAFVERYLVPMASAIWSARRDRMLEFPAHFLIGFFLNHGLLQLRDRPQWRTVVGGAQRYVEALTAPFRERIRLNCPVRRVARHAEHVVVEAAGKMPEVFDRVVFATHADQTLDMLADADELERRTLGAVAYQPNRAVLHTDTSLLPQRRRAWASWNYYVPAEPDCPPIVTYDLSRLQGHQTTSPLCLTLNDGGRVDRALVLEEFAFEHPAYGPDSLAAQRRHKELNGHRKSYYCGAYWGFGFHEDGLRSGLAVAECFGKRWESCGAVSTRAGSDIAVTSR